MTQNLYTTEVGTISFDAYLPGGRKTYVCTSLTLSMKLNAIPTASVVIGCGESILTGASDNSDNSAEDILDIVTKSADKGTSFIDCAIYEELSDTSRCIFKGCIVSASLVYKTGSVTIRAVRLECMNAACKLYCQPFGAYTNRCSADIVNKILGIPPQDEENGSDAVSTYGMYDISSLDDETLADEMDEFLECKDIATKIAYIVDGIAMLTTRALNVVNPIAEGELGTILKVGEYIKSTYFLNYEHLDLANTESDTQYNKSLCSRLLNGLKSGSILDTIINTIVTTNYMLTLVPTWEDNDFVLELRPSKAWDSSKSYDLYFSDIAEMNSTVNPLAHINDPEVFVVDFTPSIEFGAPPGVAGDPESCLVGAFSVDPQMAQWIKLRFSQSSIEFPLRKQLEENMLRFKWKEYQAPDWLRTCLIEDNGESKDTLLREAIENQRQWDKEGDEDNKEKPVIKNYDVAENIADQVAKALYAHMHGASATAQLVLLSDMRFGHLDGFVLEQHLGEIINILPQESTPNPPLAMRGMLEGIQFEYSAGLSASCKYTITLSRVRPFSEDEQVIECPLYVNALSK